jgi:ATP adenylyltransferase
LELKVNLYKSRVPWQKIKPLVEKEKRMQTDHMCFKPMTGNDSDPDCLFCQWIREKTATARVGTVAAFKEGYPVTAGHLLIVPLRHTTDWFGMTGRELNDSHDLIRTLAKEIRHDDPTVTGFNIGTNSGASAG